MPPGGIEVTDVVGIRRNIPFAWIRQTASSFSGFSYTARPGEQFIAMQGPVHDGVQSWWQVRDIDGPTIGWVEEQSLEYIRDNRG